jgi:hypothetical protein
MKNKILISGVLTMAVAVVGSVHAASKTSAESPKSQTPEQIRTTNQGAINQVQAQNNEQVQNGNGAGAGAGAQVQPNPQAGSAAGNQVQNENRIQNSEQGGSQGQNSPGSATAQQRRSQVANAVQALLQVADRNDGIGQQVRTIARTQTQNQEKLEANLQAVQARSGLVKFLVGADIEKIKNAQNILEQNREQIKQLNQIKVQLSNQGDQQVLAEQVKLLEQTNSEFANSLSSSEGGFSLFGWMFKLFS